MSTLHGESVATSGQHPDLFERHIARLIDWVLIVCAAIALVLFCLTEQWVRAGIAACYILIAAASLLLLRQKRDQTGFLVLTIGAWLLAAAGMVSSGGNMASTALMFPGLLIFSAWISSRAVVILTVATFILFVVCAYLLSNGLLPSTAGISHYQRLMVQLMALGFAGGMGFFAARNMHSRLNRLIKSEREVYELNNQLEKRVAARTAELQNALKDMESFSYSVSHDLRAPLRGISGYSALLREDLGDRLSQEQAHFLTQIESSSRRMSTLVDDLLRYSRTSRAEPQSVPIDMRQMVERVVADLAASCSAVQIHIGELPSVVADPGLLYQVWQNLIENACKFSAKATHPRVEIGGATRDAQIEYWVRDNGAGFDMNHVDKLFGVFQRLHTDDEFEGSGIGLASVRGIIERHGGTVRAEGSVNQGATFRFFLPVVNGRT